MEYTDLKNRRSFLPRLKHVGFLTIYYEYKEILDKAKPTDE